jgi:hypothetical protein
VLPFALAARRRPDLLRPSADLVPAGDLLGLARYPIGVLGFSGRSLGRWWNRLLRSGSARWDAAVASIGPPPQDPERALRRWPNAGAAWLAITALLLLLPLSTLTVLRPLETPRVASETPASVPATSEPRTPVAVVAREHSATSAPRIAPAEGRDAGPRKRRSISPAASDAPAAGPLIGERPAAQALQETSTAQEQAPEAASPEATSPPADTAFDDRRPEPAMR